MNLKTYEYLFLYAINPDSNKIYFTARASLDYGIAGALIYELMKEGIMTIENDQLIIKEKQIEDETLKITLDIVKKINKKSVRKNTSKIANRINPIKESILRDLVQKEILETKKGHFLFIFENTTYIFKNKNILPPYTQKLKSTVFQEIDATNNEVMILNLIEACGLTKKVFSDISDRKKFKEWLKLKK